MRVGIFRVRNLLRTFLIMALFSGTAAQLSATTHSRKTFLMPQAIGTNLPMELTTWHELAYQKLEKRNGHRIFSHLAMTPFYQGSDNKDDIGKYFGIGNGKNSFTVKDQATFDAGDADILGEYLIHDVKHFVASGEVKFNPKQETWGIRFDYFQSFGHPFGGLFFKASMPVVYVKNSVGMDISDSVPLDIAGESFSLKDFFAGKVKITPGMEPNDENLQSQLEKAKIPSEEEGKFGVADINLALGYKLRETKSDHVYLSAQIIVPTGPHPNGELLFQPVVGNGKHFGLGARLDTAFELWSGKRSAVKLLLDVDYRYLFEASEHRTLGVKDFSIGNRPSNMAHYFLAGEIGKEAQSLFPAANILTQGLRVKPGNQFDIFADLSFKCCGFALDLGYNFFYKDEEDCWMKERWADGKYALVQDVYSTLNRLTDEILCKLDKANLDVDAAKTPSQLTNKIFAGLGYEFSCSKSVLGLVGIGGAYEFASDNAALENYSAWIKAGVSF